MNHMIVTCIAVTCIAVIAAAVWITRALRRELQRRLDDVDRPTL